MSAEQVTSLRPLLARADSAQRRTDFYEAARILADDAGLGEIADDMARGRDEWQIEVEDAIETISRQHDVSEDEAWEIFESARVNDATPR